jgi:hypothetical protein
VEIMMQIVSVVIGFSLIAGSLAGWTVLIIALWQGGYRRERGVAQRPANPNRGMPEAA